jgi:putative tryptophan/tyrosine transport system substrate-binding protein
MQRREFIVGLGGAAAAWSLGAHAQQPALPVIGLVSAAALDDHYTQYLVAWRSGLADFGYVEDKNVSIEYHWLEGRYDRLAPVMADMVRRGVAVFSLPGGTASPLAARAATETIPIVFGIGDDPIKLGLVASLARPGGNATGINYYSNEVAPKRLGLLSALVPAAKHLAVLINPRNSVSAEATLRDVQDAARLVKWPIDVFKASTGDEIDAAFDAMENQGTDALFIGSDPYFNSRRFQLAELAKQHLIAACYSDHDFAEAGGLLSYGTDVANMWRQVGVYTARILNGANPAELPVMQSTKFIFALNMRTAKVLDINVPRVTRALADMVFE